MRYSAVALSSVVLLGTICAISAHAQQSTATMSDSGDAGIQQRAAAHMTHVRGADNPAAIPLGIKLRKFFRQADRQLVTDAGRDQLKGALQLSKADWDLLTAAAQRDRSAIDAIEQADQKRVQDICRRTAAREIEPTAIGRLLTEAQDKNEDALTQHYRAVVARLSSEGQRALLSYVDNTAIKSMSYGRVDFEGLIAEFPEMAADIARKCANQAGVPQQQEAASSDNGFAADSEQQ